MVPFFILLTLFVSDGIGLKILMYQTALGHSHMQFSGVLTDVLAEAGHEVHLLIAEWNPATKSDDGTTRAASFKRIRLDNNSTSLIQMDYLKDPFKISPAQFLFTDSKQRQLLANLIQDFCAKIVNDDELLRWIRSQHFDLVLTSMYGSCQYGLFHQTGIKLVMGFVATSALHFILNAIGIDTPSSYTSDLPIVYGQSDDMSYWERALNFIVQNVIYHFVLPKLLYTEDQLWQRKYGSSFPSIKDLVRKTTFIFVNTYELIEFPRPLSQKVIYIGGISIKKSQKISEYYEKLLSLRPGTVLFSFGSIVRTSLMPYDMIVAFLEAFRNFGNYTFIWKTDVETMKIELFNDYPNVELVEWMPQNDLLNDGRVNAFITHAGLNSMEEGIHAGVPMVTIPLFGDQVHNAAVAAKRQIAYSLFKENITTRSVTDALRAVLCNGKYAENAKQLKLMIYDKPRNDVKKIFREYVEFAARYPRVGEYLQLHSVNLNWIQLYCIDFIAPATVVLLLLAYTAWRFLLIMLADSNFVEELNMINVNERQKSCYGATAYILQVHQAVAVYLQEKRLLVAINCIWKFSGKLFYCIPTYDRILFHFKLQRPCTNLIQFSTGFTIFCALSHKAFVKITYDQNNYMKQDKLDYRPLFLEQLSNIVLLTNKSSHTAAFREVRIFDGISVEQLPIKDVYKKKYNAVVGQLIEKEHDIHLKNMFVMRGDKKTHQLPDLHYIMNAHNGTIKDVKQYCVAQLPESEYFDIRKYKKEYIKKFLTRLYGKIAASEKRMTFYKESVIQRMVDQQFRFYSFLGAIVLMTPILAIVLTMIFLFCCYKPCTLYYIKRLFLAEQ